MMLHELKRFNQLTTYGEPTNIDDIKVCTLREALHSFTRKAYDQTSVICGLKFSSRNLQIYHIVLWSPHKQNKIAYSSFGVEILAASNAIDRRVLFKRQSKISIPA